MRLRSGRNGVKIHPPRTARLKYDADRSGYGVGSGHIVQDIIRIREIPRREKDVV
jgi:hypothetical protein